MKLKAIIFDMDGLLVDTETYWQKAEIEAFSEIGVALTVEDCKLAMGLRCDEAVGFFLERFDLRLDVPHMVSVIEAKVIAMAEKKPQVLPGVIQATELFRRLGFKLAVCSSSSSRVIHGVLRAAGLLDTFEILVSAEKEAYGKPHPAVYLSALKTLDIRHFEALVFEDSIFGIVAAKAAKIPVVAVPNVLPRTDPRFGIADTMIDSMHEVNEPWLFNFLK